jgi:hypothetical protein
MKMNFKFRDGRPDETHFYNTKKECNTHFDYVLRYRREEIKTVYIGRIDDVLERINIKTKDEILKKYHL